MPRSFLQVAVYPLILLNLALGLLMVSLSHQAILLTASGLRRGGVTEQLGPLLYVQGSFDSVGVILLGIATLIIFPLLERYYGISKKYCTKLSASVPTRIRSPKACWCKLLWKCNYYRTSANSRNIVFRFLRVVGIQLIHIACIQLLILSLVGKYIERMMRLALLSSATGILGLIFINQSGWTFEHTFCGQQD